MKFRYFPAAILPIALISISSLGQIKSPSNPTTSLPGTTAKGFVQVIFQPNTDELSSMSEDVLYQLSKKASRKHVMEISVLSETGVSVIFSKTPTRRAIQELRPQLDSDPSTHKLEPISSKDEQLVAAVQRLSDRVLSENKHHPVTVYIITGGTSSSRVIAQIKTITENLSQHNISNTRLYLVGVEPQNRLSFAKAFAPIGSSVEFAGPEYSEWIQLIRKL
jgi:hypothetical protein